VDSGIIERVVQSSPSFITIEYGVLGLYSVCKSN